MAKKPLPPVDDEELEPAVEELPELEVYRIVPEKPVIRCLVYSEPGGGKTTLGATMQDHPAMRDVLMGNIEGGHISIAHRGDIHAVNIDSTEGLYALYRNIAEGVEPFASASSIMIDNLTELQTLNLDEIVTNEVDHGKTGRDDYDFIDQGDYGKSTMQIGRIIRWFKNLDKHLFITAHAKFVYPANRNTRSGTNVDVEPVAVLPMLSQKLMKTAMGMVDYVWFLQYDPETNSRHLLTRPDGIYQAKTRGPHFAEAMGPVVTNPTMPQLYDLLVQSESGAKKPKPQVRKR